MSTVVKVAIVLVVVVAAARLTATAFEIMILPLPVRLSIFAVLAIGLLAAAILAFVRHRRGDAPER